MAKQTEFEQPPKGHVGLLAYDRVTEKWYAILGDDDGHILLEVTSITLPDGAATSLKQLPDGHAVTIDNVSLAVTGAFYPATQPVSASALPLPSGAAIESKQSTIITTLQSLQNLVGALHDVGLDELDVFLSGQDVDVEVTQTTPADLAVAQHQYDGSDWHKSNLLWGYRDRWFEDLGGQASAAEYSQYTTAVGEGYVHVLQALSVRNITRATTDVILQVHAGVGNTVNLVYAATLDVDEVVLFTGAMTMKEGDLARVVMDSCVSGDAIRAGAWGYKMKIDM